MFRRCSVCVGVLVLVGVSVLVCRCLSRCSSSGSNCGVQLL